ncbi:MAG TPA: DUF2723 domain-containing protein, partial [Candidatus Obscuribacter sp.]|nr:DUF2723 domain-containing protein [Candidatus Obscuribacter sp.]
MSEGFFPKGAARFEIEKPCVGRLFAWVGDAVSDDPATIAYAVNLLSALSTAFGAMFICWSTTILARLVLVGREPEMSQGQTVAALGAGLVAGLSMAFASSVWFSAVEG